MKTKHRNAARGKRQGRYQADPQAWVNVIKRTQPLTTTEILREMTQIYDSFNAIDKGTETKTDEARMLALGCAVRARGLAIDPAAGGVTGDRVIDACIQAYRRKASNGRFGFSGPEREHVLTAIDTWDQMIEKSQPHEISKAGRDGAEFAELVMQQIDVILEERKAA